MIYDEIIQNELSYISAIRIGCLLINSNRIYQMSDGTMVMYGARFSNAKEAENALYARTENLVILDHCTASTESYENSWYYDWGESGKFHMDGIIYLEYSDAQNNQSGSRSISAIGQLTGEIDTNQCTIKTR